MAFLMAFLMASLMAFLMASLMARKQAPSAIARASREALGLGTVAGDGLALREKLLELAGVTLVEQATLTRAAITRLTEGLNALKVVRLVVNRGLNNGEVLEFIDVDHASRHRAAAELLDRFGVQVSKSSGNVNNIGQLTVIVTKRDAPRELATEAPEPDVIDVTPLDRSDQ